MKFGQIIAVSCALLLTSAAPAFAIPKIRRGPTAPRMSRSRPTRPRVRPASARAIDNERATQIQTALIQSGYLTGTPTGSWNEETQSAMQKFQSDNGWQTKLIPDSRAIIKLGLGPGANPSTSGPAPSDASALESSQGLGPSRSSN